MASRNIQYPRDPVSVDSGTEFPDDELEEVTISDHESTADSIPLILDELRHNYNVQLENDIQFMPEETQTEGEAHAVFEDAINDLRDENVDRNKSCGSCSKELRVENVSSFKRGQHISLPGQRLRSYNAITHKVHTFYRHHAIIKEINQTAGTKVEMILIHFSKIDGDLKICETEETYDLTHDEIYIIQYTHPRYTADEIVTRAELMLPENREDLQEFSSYNIGTRNCEHFATWCVIGEGESIQVQDLRQRAANALQNVFGHGSQILKAILKLLYLSSDEIASSLTTAVNVPGFILGGASALYLIYCIAMTVLYIRDYRKGHMCWSCLRGKLKDLWIAFGVFGVTSLICLVIVQFALPLIGPAVGIPLVVIVVLLSAALQWSVQKIRKSVQNPFSVDKTAVKAMSELNIGDIVSLRYYGLEHVMVVSEVHEENDNSSKGRLRGIHYGLPRLFGTREIMEEYFPLDVTRDMVKIYDCRHLLCHSPESVVMRARKRVGEKKWALGSNRSDHFCYWAKVQQRPRGVCEEWNNGDLAESETKSLSSLFIEENEVHLTSDIKVGDVIQFKDTGILVGMVHTHTQNGRYCQIEMIVSSLFGHCCLKVYAVDLNKDRLYVKKYHPAHCHPMAVRAERAKKMKNKNGKWWTNEGFIEHCIMLSS